MTESIVDLRSDTVTRPTRAMLQAMIAAEVGDDVLGDDPTVLALEAKVAALLGKPAACFVPSGTMANQTAIRAQTEPGDEIIAHGDSHIAHYETGAPAALSGCGIYPLTGVGGRFTARDVAAAIRPRRTWMAPSRLLVIENTHNRGGGTVWPLSLFAEVCAEAHRHGLAIHLDGARLFNACVATGETPTAYTSHVETVAVCFSKALGAPAGSAVAGSVETIDRVRRFRKMFGGAMRQSGILAAAAIHALDHHLERLADDHRRARRLAEGVSEETSGFTIDLDSVQSNMVYIEVDERIGSADTVCLMLAERGVRMAPMDRQRLRAVTHLDVDDAGIERAIDVVRTCFSTARSPS